MEEKFNFSDDVVSLAKSITTGTQILIIAKLLSKIVNSTFTIFKDIYDIYQHHDEKTKMNIYKSQLLQACDSLNNGLDKWSKKVEAAAKSAK